MEVHTPALDGPLIGSLYIGEPQPGNQYRVFMIFDGFGIHAKLVADVPSRPADGPADDVRHRPPPGALRGVRPAPVRLRSRPRRDPDPLHDLQRQLGADALERVAGAAGLESERQHQHGPGRQVLPRPGASLQPASRRGNLERRRRRLLQLHAEARPRRRRPVPRRPELRAAARVHRHPARDHLLPGGRDRRRRAELSAAPSGPRRAAPPRARSARPTSPPAPAATPSTRSARCTSPGRSRERRSRWSRSPRPWRAPTTTASSSSGWPCTWTRSTRTSSPPRTPCRRSSAASRSGCARSRSTSTSPTSRSTRPTAIRPSRSTPRGSATRARSPTSPPTSRSSTAPGSTFKPKMTMRQLGGRKATRRATNPGLQIDLRTRPGDANIKSLSVTLSHAFEIDQRHLGNICSEKELAEKRVRRADADRQGHDDDAAARPAALRPGLRGLRVGRAAEARLHPQRPGQAGAAGRHDDGLGRPPADDRPGRAGRPDRPLLP